MLVEIDEKIINLDKINYCTEHRHARAQPSQNEPNNFKKTMNVHFVGSDNPLELRMSFDEFRRQLVRKFGVKIG